MREVGSSGWYSYPSESEAVGVTVPTVATEPTGSYEGYGVPPQKKNETTIPTTTPTTTHDTTSPKLVSPIRLVQVGTVSNKYSGTSDLGPYRPRRTDLYRPVEVGTPRSHQSAPPTGRTDARGVEPLMGAGLHIRVPHSSVPPPPAHAGSPDPEPRGPAGSPTPTGPGRGRDLLAQLVSGLRGPAWRDREVARLEREGWRVSGGDERYGSVWMVKEVKCD